MAMMTRLMRSTLFECEKHNFVSIAFHACRPGQELVHVFGPGNTFEQLFTYVHVFCSAINFQVKLSTFQHEYLELTFTIFQLEYLEIFLGLLPPAARLLLPPVAKMMTEFL